MFPEFPGSGGISTGPAVSSAETSDRTAFRSGPFALGAAGGSAGGVTASGVAVGVGAAAVIGGILWLILRR